jgi:hypothetical protein
MTNIVDLNVFKKIKNGGYVVVDREHLTEVLKATLTEIAILDECYPDNENIQNIIKEMNLCLEELKIICSDPES